MVWWSHFYWFSIFSKDLCFMNAFSLPVIQFFVFLPHLRSEFIFFCWLNCYWQTARSYRISYISLYICEYAVYVVLVNLCDELFLMALRALDTIEHFNTLFKWLTFTCWSRFFLLLLFPHFLTLAVQFAVIWPLYANQMKWRGERQSMSVSERVLDKNEAVNFSNVIN